MKQTITKERFIEMMTSCTTCRFSAMAAEEIYLHIIEEERESGVETEFNLLEIATKYAEYNTIFDATSDILQKDAGVTDDAHHAYQLLKDDERVNDIIKLPHGGVVVVFPKEGNVEKLTGPIDPKWIRKAEEAGILYKKDRKWLTEKQRTWEELKSGRPEWYVMALENISELPPDITGLAPSYRVAVMLVRPDCKPDLTGLGSHNRTWLMINRSDCPVLYRGLTREDARLVYEERTRDGWPCPPLPDWAK